MGYNTNDPDLLAFMRKHDDDLEDLDPRGYNWGRPINEVRTALNVLTGTEHGEVELCHLHGNGGTPVQQFLKNELYIRCAERWREWWESHWQDCITDESYSKVDLPDLPAGVESIAFDRDAELVVDYSMSNMTCESILDDNPQRVFYDLDTGRMGTLHKQWKRRSGHDNERIISKWAVAEGYDLMGSQIEMNGKVVYVLRWLAGDCWEVPFALWNNQSTSTAADLIRQGRPVAEILAIKLHGTDTPDYRRTGLFFVITRHGTPAFVRLGVEVHDTSMPIGIVLKGDEELNPKGFQKGRRFAIKLLKHKESQ